MYEPTDGELCYNQLSHLNLPEADAFSRGALTESISLQYGGVQVFGRGRTFQGPL